MLFCNQELFFSIKTKTKNDNIIISYISQNYNYDMAIKIFFLIAFMLLTLSLIGIENADALKSITVNQNCNNIVLEVQVLTEDGTPAKNVKIFPQARMEVLASGDENGNLIMPTELQGKTLRIGGGSYEIISFTFDDCKPVEIKFEKTDHDIVIVNHQTWSNFDSSQDYSDAPYLTPYTGNMIVGDIINLSEHNLTDIEITIQTRGGNSGFSETSTWYPIKKILRPGEASPFFAYSLGGFGSYTVAINNYKATSEEPIKPLVEISDVKIDKDKRGNESVIIVCENTLENPEDFLLLFLGYSEQNLLENAIIGTSYLMPQTGIDTSNCITDGHASAPEFLEYAKANRFEVFIIKSPPNLYFDAMEMKNQVRLNAYQNENSYLKQFPIYSDYFPDSLVPKYMNVDEIRANAERHSEIFKSRESETNPQAQIESTNKSIPEWVRNNAKWWAEGAIRDSDFTTGIQFLIKEGIITIPETAENIEPTADQEIPSWIKNNADWWSKGLISDDDFVKGIQYLVGNGIIAV